MEFQLEHIIIGRIDIQKTIWIWQISKNHRKDIAKKWEKEDNNSITVDEIEKDQRVIKPDGKFKFEGKWYHSSEKLAGKIIEVRTTLKGIEVWYDGSFIKRWKYWEYILSNAVDYMLEKYLV